MSLYVLEWRFEPALSCLLWDGTLIRGRKRNMKWLIGKAEQPNSICGAKCFSTPENVFNVWPHAHNLFHLSFSLLCNFILPIKYLTSISVCLMFRILEDDLDLYMKDTQLFLSASIWVISLLASEIKGWIAELWRFSTDAQFQCACSSHWRMFEMALACFSVSLAQLSTYPLLRTIDKVTSIHPHIWISFSLVSMVNNRTKGLGWMEAGRTMQEHLRCLHTLFENLFCLRIKNLWQLWRSYNSFSATKRLKT